jgi:hypothetical protein
MDGAQAEHWELVNDLRHRPRVIDVVRPDADGNPVLFDSLIIDPNLYSVDMEIRVNDTYDQEAALNNQALKLELEGARLREMGQRGTALKRRTLSPDNPLTDEEKGELVAIDRVMSEPETLDIVNGSARNRKVSEAARLIRDLTFDVIIAANPEWDLKRAGRLTRLELNHILSFFVNRGPAPTMSIRLLDTPGSLILGTQLSPTKNNSAGRSKPRRAS